MRIVIILILILIISGCQETKPDTEPTIDVEPTKKITTTTINTGEDSTTSIDRDVEREILEDMFDPLENQIVSCGERTIIHEKDNCYYGDAIKEKDRSICEKITGDPLKSRCRAEIDLDSDKCKRIGNVYHRDWCYRNIAYKKPDIEVCDGITMPERKDDCLLSFLKFKKLDPYKCFEIQDVVKKDECIYLHVQNDLIKGDLCYLIENPSLEIECNQTYIKPLICSARIT